MKQIILLTLSLGLTFFVSAQTVLITEAGQTTSMNGTLSTQYTTDGSEMVYDIDFKNISGVQKNWYVTRKALTTVPSGWQDWICWGIQGEIGQCYNTIATNPWATPDGTVHLDLATGDTVSFLLNNEKGSANLHYLPGANNYGSCTFRYYIHEKNQPYEDSVDVRIVHSALSVKDNPTIEFSVYPNPTSNVLTISADGLDNFDVKMVDVLGKVVMQESATKTKKIDVSNFKNGVYILSISGSGVATQTKRIVVRH